MQAPDWARDSQMNHAYHRAELLSLSAILILAGVLRMGWPGLTEYKFDEAQMMSLALDMIEEQLTLPPINGGE